MNEPLNLHTVEDFYGLLRDRDGLRRLVEEGYIRSIFCRELGEFSYRPTEKLMEIQKRETGQDYCPKCLASDPKEGYAHRILFRNLIAAFGRAGYDWKVNPRPCPHQPVVTLMRKSRGYISLGRRRFALDVVLNEAMWGRLLKDFQNQGKFRDVNSCLLFIFERKLLPLALDSAKDLHWLYFSFYDEAIADLRSARIFQGTLSGGGAKLGVFLGLMEAISLELPKIWGDSS